VNFSQAFAGRSSQAARESIPVPVQARAASPSLAPARLPPSRGGFGGLVTGSAFASSAAGRLRPSQVPGVLGVDAKSYGGITDENADLKQSAPGRDDKDPGPGPQSVAQDPAVAQPPGPQAAGGDAKVAVTLPSIRDPRSPASMKDRIAPGVDTPVPVTISGGDGKTPFDVSVDGNGGPNGTVTVNGAASASIAGTGTTKVTLQGTKQTGIGHGGNLNLAVKQGGATLATSNGFSVSAIPRDYSDTFVSLLTGAKRGFIVQDGWKSDSSTKSISDLDGAEISEMVEYHLPGTGCFKAATPGHNSSYLPADSLSTDTHSRSTSELTGPGTLVANQTCKFKDNRSGSTDIPMQNSGYVLTRAVDFKPGSTTALQITTSKVGTATSAKGIASDAGAGSITKSQDV
jgi:hypothetical protein